jgi:hypothetical protein
MEPLPQPLRLTLELDPGTEPLSGRVIDGRGTRRQFFGWTGLSAALSVSIDEAAPADQLQADERARRSPAKVQGADPDAVA